MKQVMKPEKETTILPTPNGLVTVRIDRDTGLRVDPQDPDGEFEIFRKEYAPAELFDEDIKANDSFQEIF